jgi:hypothetical protein
MRVQIATTGDLVLLRFIPIWADFTYFRLLEFRDGDYAGDWFFDHVNDYGFGRGSI